MSKIRSLGRLQDFLSAFKDLEWINKFSCSIRRFRVAVNVEKCLTFSFVGKTNEKYGTNEVLEMLVLYALSQYCNMKAFLSDVHFSIISVRALDWAGVGQQTL